jgi:hypothetical protein
MTMQKSRQDKTDEQRRDRLLNTQRFKHFTEEPESGHFRPQSTTGNSSPEVLSKNGYFNHDTQNGKTLKELEIETGLTEDRQDIQSYIYSKSTCNQSDRQTIKAYLKSRSLDIADQVIDEMGLRVSDYKNDLMIITPLKDIRGDLIQINRTYLCKKTYHKKGKSRLKGSAPKRDRAVLLRRNNDSLVVFEGLEDGLTYYHHARNSKSVLICFGTAGFRRIKSFISRFKNIEVILDPDEKDQSLKNSYALGKPVNRMIPTLGIGVDANKALQQGQFKNWMNSLQPVPWTEVEHKAGKQNNQNNVGNNISNYWPNPEPLEGPLEKALDFPIKLLPQPIREAVVQYQAYGKQPMGLVVSSALGAVSLATQGLADVARDAKLISPISLNSLVIAESGERKTACDAEFSKSIREWQKNERERLKPEIQKNRAEMDAWRAQQAGIEQEIKKAAKTNTIENNIIDELTQELVYLKQHPIMKILEPNYFYEDVTPQALGWSLANSWPSASLWSDEGGTIVGSYGMNNDSILGFFSLMNRLWDGNDYETKRKQAEQFRISGRRFTCQIMLQDAVLQQLISTNQGLSRGTGFLSRFLISRPESTMGTREYALPPDDDTALMAFHNRIAELLKIPLGFDDNGRLQPTVITLSQAAKNVWIEYFNEVEKQLSPFGEFVDIKDFASKNAENAVRLAGCFHVFENGPTGQISLDTMTQGISIAAWFLNEIRRLMLNLSMPQDVMDAELLRSWLKNKNKMEFLPREILQLGPQCLRNKTRRDKATKILKEHHWIKDGKQIYYVNPKIYDLK